MSIQSVRSLYDAGLGSVAVQQLLEIDAAATTAQTTADTASTAAATASTAAATAQTSADYAAFYLDDNVTQIIWSTDADTAAWPANTTQDLTVAWLTKAGAAVASRVLRGTFTQSSATIAVTAVSNTNNLAGASTAYALTGNGTKSVRATITLTLPDASKRTAVVSWTAMDLNTAGVTPATGGGK